MATKQPTKPFSDAFLLAYSSEHVQYEVAMFFSTAKALTQPSLEIAGSSADSVLMLRNLIVEGFGMHLRNVIEFLYPSKPRQTDVVASDFCAPQQWESTRPEIPNSLKNARKRAHQELAHLTALRRSDDDPAKPWDASALANEVRPIIKLFTKIAKAGALSPAVAEAVR